MQDLRAVTILLLSRGDSYAPGIGIGTGPLSQCRVFLHGVRVNEGHLRAHAIVTQLQSHSSPAPTRLCDARMRGESARGPARKRSRVDAPNRFWSATPLSVASISDLLTRYTKIKMY